MILNILLGFFLTQSTWAVSATELEDLQCQKKVGQMLIVKTNSTIHPFVGNLILMPATIDQHKTNKELVEYINKLQTSKKELNQPRYFIAIDQEGGLVQRLNENRGFIKIPSHKVLGNLNSEVTTEEFASISAQQLSAVGVNLNFSTVVDLDNKESAVISKVKRSFSDDPEKVARLACSHANGFQENGVLATLKHFPGHGSATQDSHIKSATSDLNYTELKDKHILAFKKTLACMKQTPVIMVSHLNLPNALIDGKVPASLSGEVIGQWLRKDLDFKGLVVTDDLSMQAVRLYEPNEEKAIEKAILAGSDLLILGNMSANNQGMIMKNICNKIRVGKDSEKYQKISQNIEASNERILAAKEQLDAPETIPLLSNPLSQDQLNELAQLTFNKHSSVKYKEPNPEVKSNLLNFKPKKDSGLNK